MERRPNAQVVVVAALLWVVAADALPVVCASNGTNRSGPALRIRALSFLPGMITSPQRPSV
jgi:hypothetical protein